jgi:hypothetical protein
MVLLRCLKERLLEGRPAVYPLREFGPAKVVKRYGAIKMLEREAP